MWDDEDLDTDEDYCYNEWREEQAYKLYSNTTTAGQG